MWKCDWMIQVLQPLQELGSNFWLSASRQLRNSNSKMPTTGGGLEAIQAKSISNRDGFEFNLKPKNPT